MVIRYAPDKSVLVVTKGHPFDHAAFFAMLDATLGSEDDGCGISWTHVEHPLAAEAIGAGLAESYDALLFYDMPGYDFRNPEPPLFVDPPEAFKQAFLDLTRRGKPMLFLHHALASWPAWRRYGDLIGGHFNYERFPGGGVCDGYRHDVEHFVQVVDDHPVTRGLGAGFSITDEIYLTDIDEIDKLPLLRSSHAFTDVNFYSAELALRGKLFSREGWRRQDGSNLICWAKAADRSPLVYLQSGHDAVAFENPAFRRVVGNAVRWLIGPEAAEWATRSGRSARDAVAQGTAAA